MEDYDVNKVYEERERIYKEYKPKYEVITNDNSFSKVYEGRLKESKRKFRIAEPSDLDEVVQRQTEGTPVIELIAEHLVTLERHKSDESYSAEPTMNLRSKEYTPGMKIALVKQMGGGEKAPLFFLWNYMIWSLSQDYFRPPTE